MNLSELKDLLRNNLGSRLQFVLPDGDLVPPHFHLTEVGLVRKAFIDCGGTQRSTETCLLQLWTAEDFDHRLETAKLLQILETAASVLKSDSLPVEVEYGPNVASIYTLGDSVSAFGVVRFHLVGKRTDCLAKEQCGIVGSADSTGCC